MIAPLKKEVPFAGILGFPYLFYTSRVIRMHTLNFCTNLMVQTPQYFSSREVCAVRLELSPLREVYSLGTQPLSFGCVIAFTKAGTWFYGLHQEKRLTSG